MIMEIITPLIAELALVVRVVAVYPPFVIPVFQRASIYGTITLIKLAHVANIISACVVLGRSAGSSSLAWQVSSATVAWTLPQTRAEWFLHIFDIMLSPFMRIFCVVF